MALKVETPADLVREIKVQIGDEWIARKFAKPIERKIACAHVMKMAATMGGFDLNEEPTDD